MQFINTNSSLELHNKKQLNIGINIQPSNKNSHSDLAFLINANLN